MVFQGNPAVYNAAWITLRVSFGATLIASLIGLPLGYFLASTSFPGKGFCTIVLQTLLGFPTVVIGLLVYGFLSRRGPFGFADLLFTPSGIVIGLVVLAFPIVTMFTMTAVSGIDPRAREMALTLGASPRRAAWTLFWKYVSDSSLPCSHHSGESLPRSASRSCLGGISRATLEP